MALLKFSDIYMDMSHLERLYVGISNLSYLLD